MDISLNIFMSVWLKCLIPSEKFAMTETMDKNQLKV